MKIPSILFLSCILPVLSACSGRPAHNHTTADSAQHNADKTKSHSDSGLIVLDGDRIEKLGIMTEDVFPGEFSNVIRVSGEITALPGSEGIVSSRQAGIVKLAGGVSEGMSVPAGRTIATVSAKGLAGGDSNETARVAYEAAKRELDRLTPLHKEGIVSTRDYNAALQQVESARAMMGTNAGRGGSSATAPVAGVISRINVVDGEFVESGQPIAVISSNNSLSLRVDLPESQVGHLPSISGARFRPSYSSEYIDVIASGGRMVSRPSAAIASGGYIPVYFTLPADGQQLINGTYCEVYLLGNIREDVLSVAEDAVSEQQGEYFVYVEHSPGHYEKKNVKIGTSDGIRREILAGLSAGEKVVSEGMIFVRLAESSNVMPEGHSHTH